MTLIARCVTVRTFYCLATDRVEQYHQGLGYTTEICHDVIPRAQYASRRVYWCISALDLLTRRRSAALTLRKRNIQHIKKKLTWYDNVRREKKLEFAIKNLPVTGQV